MTDEIIIKGCLKQESKAQKALYDKYSPMLFGICLRYASSRAEAEDLLQLGFIKIFRKLNKYKPTGAFKGWLYRVMVNVALEQIRKKSLTTHALHTHEVDYLLAQREQGLDKLLEQDVLKMVQQLPDGYRLVFNMYVIEGYAHKEIADILGISEATSKSQLSRAKAALRKLIEKVMI